jgi:protein TonB
MKIKDGLPGLMIWVGSLVLCATLFAQDSSQATKSEQTAEAQQPPPQPTIRVRVSGRASEAFLVKKVEAEYPPGSGIARTGSVLLHILVGLDGKVLTADLVSGSPLLASSAIKAVKQWKYKPYLLNGQPAEMDTQVKVTFRE